MCKIASSRIVYVWKGTKLKKWAEGVFIQRHPGGHWRARRGCGEPVLSTSRERTPCAPTGACQLPSQVDTDLVGGHQDSVFLILVDRSPERRALWAPGGSWLTAEDVSSPLAAPATPQPLLKPPQDAGMGGSPANTYVHTGSSVFAVCVCVDRA